MSRILFYPPQPVADELPIGIAEHTDVEFFTFLLQGPGVTALHVLSKASHVYPRFSYILLHLFNRTGWRMDRSTAHRRHPRSQHCRSLLSLDQHALQVDLPSRRQHHREDSLLHPRLLWSQLQHNDRNPAHMSRRRRASKVPSNSRRRCEVEFYDTLKPLLLNTVVLTLILLPQFNFRRSCRSRLGIEYDETMTMDELRTLAQSMAAV